MSVLTIDNSLADPRQAVNESIEDVQQRDERQQCDKHILKSFLLVVQEVVCPLASTVMADVCIQEVCDSESGQAQDVAVGRLVEVQGQRTEH